MIRRVLAGLGSFLGVLVFGVSSGMSAGGADLAVAEYETRLGHTFEYRLNTSGDRVVRASGVLSSPVDEDRVEAARGFFSENTGMFGVDAEVVAQAAAKTLTSRNAIHVALTQKIDGVPVMGPSSYVHYDAEGRIFLVQNNFLPGLHPCTTPRLAAGEIAQRVNQACSEADASVSMGTSQLVLRREGDNLRLVYCVPTHVVSTSPRNWLVFVDAREPDVAPQRVEVSFPATAKGTIYPENRVTTSLKSMVFRDLDASTRLSGLHVRTYNGNDKWDLPDSAKHLSKFTTASKSDGDYTYRPPPLSLYDPAVKQMDPRFPEAMAYYHVDRAHDTLKAMGFKELDLQMPVFVNTPYATGGAGHRYVPGVFTSGLFPETGLLEIGTNFFGEPQAADSDIIYHEYGHAVLDHIQPALGTNVEHVYGRAYHEGWGWILAAGLNKNSELGEYGNGPVANSLNFPWYYPTHVTDPASGLSNAECGLIIGRAFWAMYKELGGTPALQLFLDANYLLDGTENFFGIREALMTAASSSLQEQAVENAFFNVGLFLQYDFGSQAKVDILDVYTAGGVLYATLEKKTSFRALEPVYVCIDAKVLDTNPGYYIYGTLTVSNGQAFPRITQLGWRDAPYTEITKGTHSGNDPYVLYALQAGPDTPAGTYDLTIEGHIGGTTKTFTKSMKITIGQ